MLGQVKQLLDILSSESLQLPAALPSGVHLVPDGRSLPMSGVWDGFVVRGGAWRGGQMCDKSL